MQSRLEALGLYLSWLNDHIVWHNDNRDCVCSQQERVDCNQNILGYCRGWYIGMYF